MKLKDILNEIQKELKSVTIQYVGSEDNIRRVTAYFTDGTNQKFMNNSSQRIKALDAFEKSEYYKQMKDKGIKYEYIEFDPS